MSLGGLQRDFAAETAERQKVSRVRATTASLATQASYSTQSCNSGGHAALGDRVQGRSAVFGRLRPQKFGLAEICQSHETLWERC